MRLISKGKAPRNLKNYKSKKGVTYNSYSSDIGLGSIIPPSGLRKYLLEDQGYVCAYCMQRIPHKFTEKGITKDDFKIEHFINQKSKESIKQKLDITYKNMFACCMGNEGKKKKFQTCDTRKGEDSISINPLNIAHINTIVYAADGAIYSTNATFDSEINCLLNLNEDNLKKCREAIYKSIDSQVTEYFRTPHLTKADKNEYLDKLFEWWNSKHSGKYLPFCMVAVKYLESRKRI